MAVEDETKPSEEAPDARSSVHITLHDVPGPLAGFEVKPIA